MAETKSVLTSINPLAGLSLPERAEKIEKIKAGLNAVDEGRYVGDADIEAIIERLEMNT